MSPTGKTKNTSIILKASAYSRIIIIIIYSLVQSIHAVPCSHPALCRCMIITAFDIRTSTRTYYIPRLKRLPVLPVLPVPVKARRLVGQINQTKATQRTEVNRAWCNSLKLPTIAPLSSLRLFVSSSLRLPSSEHIVIRPSSPRLHTPDCNNEYIELLEGRRRFHQPHSTSLFPLQISTSSYRHHHRTCRPDVILYHGCGVDPAVLLFSYDLTI